MSSGQKDKSLSILNIRVDSSSFDKDIEQAEQTSEILASKWFKYVNVFLIFSVIYTACCLSKWILFNYFVVERYQNLCPIAARPAKLKGYLLNMDPDFCRSDTIIGLGVHGVAGCYFIFLLITASHWFRSLIIYFERKSNEVIANHSSGIDGISRFTVFIFSNNHLIRVLKRKHFQAISFVVYFNNELVSVLFVLGILNFVLTLGMAYGIYIYIMNCLVLEEPRYLSELTYDVEDYFNIYRNAIVHIPIYFCYDVPLILSVGISIGQILILLCQALWFMLNRNLKQRTINFDNSLFKLRSHLSIKYRGRITAMLYLFSFRK